jgi:hypothetical protein
MFIVCLFVCLVVGRGGQRMTPLMAARGKGRPRVTTRMDEADNGLPPVDATLSTGGRPSSERVVDDRPPVLHTQGSGCFYVYCMVICIVICMVIWAEEWHGGRTIDRLPAERILKEQFGYPSFRYDDDLIVLSVRWGGRGQENAGGSV